MAAPNERKWPLLALTGGIASGKSTVAGLFAEHGALVISADQVARELLEPGAPGWGRLQAEFAGCFLDEDGRIDRAALRWAIFGDAVLRAKVDGLLHPLVRARIGELVAGAGRTGRPLPVRKPVFAGLVVEVPLLYEVGWQGDFDLVVVVRSDDGQAVDRLMARDQCSRSEAEAALAAQMPMGEKLALADAVIDNRGDLAATARQVAELIGRLAVQTGCHRGGRPDASPSS